MDKKILIVDDEHWRVQFLKMSKVLPESAIHATNAIEAIDRIVDDGPWNELMLDHDLETFVHDPYKREITGTDVARILSEQPWKPDLVIIHSMNPVGAVRMTHILRDKGIRVIKKPISDFLGAEVIGDGSIIPDDEHP